jgi:hypothetical protein
VNTTSKGTDFVPTCHAIPVITRAVIGAVVVIITTG